MRDEEDEVLREERRELLCSWLSSARQRAKEAEMMIKRWQLEFQMNAFSQKPSTTTTGSQSGIQFGAA